MSRSIPGTTDAPDRSDATLRLLDIYQTGLRRAVQEAIQDAGLNGWACLERLSTYLADWFSRPDWFALWALRTATQSSALGRPDAAEAATQSRQEEHRLLDRLAEATGAADPAALSSRMRAIIYGSATAAALDDGSAAAGTLRTLLATTWQDQGRHALSSSS